MATKRKANETLEQYAIRTAWELGHFWNPNNPNGFNVTYDQLSSLNSTDQVVVDAMISMAKIDTTKFVDQAVKAGVVADLDGNIHNPAIMGMVISGRCPVPDYVPPIGVSFNFDDPDLQLVVERMQQDQTLEAIGVGNWKGCNNVGDFHCSVVKVDSSGLPSFLKPVFTEVLKRVQIAYAKVGLLFYFVNQESIDLLTGNEVDGRTNINMSFVNSSDGWIGLAIVGQQQTCSSNIWCKFLNTYKGGSNEESIKTQWTTLIKHELGHNCGKGHTNGGVMNPSIVNNLPSDWVDSDPSTSWLRNQFGGVPVPIPGGNPIPPTPPSDPIQAQIDSLRVTNAIQTAQIEFLLRKYKELEK
jgi:hypothetical protein